MSQDQKPSSAAGTLGEAVESSRESYHGDAKGAAKTSPGRKAPTVGKPGDKNVKQD